MNNINKEKFYIETKKLVNQGMSYIEAICFLIENLNLEYKKVVKILDVELVENIRQEAVSKRLIKHYDEFNIEQFLKEKKQ